jgi:hypothetical protein
MLSYPPDHSTLGVVVPPTTLALADEVIDKRAILLRRAGRY